MTSLYDRLDTTGCSINTSCPAERRIEHPTSHSWSCCAVSLYGCESSITSHVPHSASVQCVLLVGCFSHISVQFDVCQSVHRFISVEKKNQLDATEWFIALTISSTCFGHLCAHHQELVTILCYYRIWCVMHQLLVVGGQVQGSRLCFRNEGSCSTAIQLVFLLNAYISSTSETRRLHLIKHEGYEIYLVRKQLSSIHAFMTCLCTQESQSFLFQPYKFCGIISTVKWAKFCITYSLLLQHSLHRMREKQVYGEMWSVLWGRVYAFACMFVPVGGSVFSSHVNFLIIRLSQNFI